MAALCRYNRLARFKLEGIVSALANPSGCLPLPPARVDR